jgi:hypothetical protein
MDHEKKKTETSASIAEDFMAWIMAGFREIASNRLLALLALMIGLVYTGLQLMKRPGRQPGYELKMSFIYSELHHKIYGDLVQGLGYMMQSGDKATVGRMLHLPDSVVADIEGFRAYNINGVPLNEDAGQSKAPFYVYADLSHNRNGELIAQGLEDYLNSNKLVQRNRPARDSELVKKIAGLSKYIGITDQVLAQYASGNAYRQPSMLDSLTEKDVTALVSLGNSLTKERIETEKKLAQTRAVESMYDIVFPHPAPPSTGGRQLLKWFLQGTGIGMVLMFLTGFFLPLFRSKKR